MAEAHNVTSAYRFLGHVNPTDRERLTLAIEQVPADVRALWPTDDSPQARAALINAASKAWRAAKANHAGSGRPADPIEVQALTAWTSNGEPIMATSKTTKTTKTGTGRVAATDEQIKAAVDDEVKTSGGKPSSSRVFTALRANGLLVGPATATKVRQLVAAVPRAKATPSTKATKAAAEKAVDAKKLDAAKETAAKKAGRPSGGKAAPTTMAKRTAERVEATAKKDVARTKGKDVSPIPKQATSRRQKASANRSDAA